MQVCPKCGVAIRYLATGYNTSQMCEFNHVTVITESGRKVKGYLLHTCNERKSDGKTSDREEEKN